MLGLLPPQFEVLRPFLPYIRPIFIQNLTTFCSMEPPGWPDFTGLTMAAVLSGGEVGAGLVATSAIAQVITNAYWYLACQCSAIVTPAPPPPLNLPTNVPAVNPPQLPSPVVGAGGCLQLVSDRYLVTAVGGTLSYILPSQDSSIAPGPISANAIGIPPTATSYSFTWDTGVANGTPEDYDFALRFYDSNFALVGGSYTVLGRQTGLTGTSAAVKPAGAAFFTATMGTANGPRTPPANVGCQISFYCSGGTPGTPVTPCCPPDPVTLGMWQQLLNLVTLLQRQLVPFAYVPGTVHAGITGSGTFAVQGPLGVKVVLTATPAATRTLEGTPPYILDVGWISIETPDGVIEEKRLTATTQVWTPRCMSDATVFGYFLNPGFTATITEILREP